MLTTKGAECHMIVLGAGNMAGCLVRTIADSGTLRKDQILLVTKSEASRDKWVSEGYPYSCTIEEFKALGSYKCYTLLVGVKPQYRKELYAALKSRKGYLYAVAVVSMLAGIDVKTIKNEMNFIEGDPGFVRITPNIPTAVGSGVTLMCGTSRQALDQTKTELSASGVVIELPEAVFNAASALSGSGPAFAFMMLEGLADGGVAAGLPRELSRTLAAQMMRGAADMALKSGKHTAELKDQVCSPAGTTIAGVGVLERNNIRGALMSAVLATKERAEQLG